MSDNNKRAHFHSVTRETKIQQNRRIDDLNDLSTHSDHAQNRMTRGIAPDRRNMLSQERAKSCRGLLMLSGSKSIRKSGSFTLMGVAMVGLSVETERSTQNRDFTMPVKGGMVNCSRKGSFRLPNKISKGVKSLTQHCIGTSSHSETSITLPESSQHSFHSSCHHSFQSLDSSDEESFYEPSTGFDKDYDFDSNFDEEEPEYTTAATVLYVDFPVGGLDEKFPVAQFSCRQLEILVGA
jgi:hypothetical protein